MESFWARTRSDQGRRSQAERIVMSKLESRRYAVHAASEARAHGHTVEAVSFEEAALEFLEAWHPQADADGDVTLVVTECESGREHCLRIDAGTGETAPCD
jgi:hypothetical protein